jgi:hypothetical protein
MGVPGLPIAIEAAAVADSKARLNAAPAARR